MARNAKKAKKPTPPRDSSTTRDSRQGKNQKGTVAIETVRQIVDCIKPYELSNSQRLNTYQNMLLDDAVATPFYFSCTLVEKAFSNYDIEYDKNDPKSIVAAEFLKFNLENMQSSLRTLARNAAESQRDGLAPIEKTFTKEKDGEWKDFWTIDKLPYIHPLTLDSSEPFIITDNGRKVVAMQQNRNAFQNSSGTITNYSFDGSLPTKIKIPRKKLLFFNYSATDAQPFGVSAFDAAYTAWREKILLQDYTLVGVTKDFAGTPILYIPGEILAEADADPSSQAALMVEQLRSNAANMHTGDQNFIIMPSDTQNESGAGAKSFEIKFQGVEGGGKSFDSESLIEQRKRAIYNVFGCGHLLLGEKGGGSYNLHEGMTNNLYFYIDRTNAMIEEVLNRDLVRQLFRLNEWDLTIEQIPKIKAGDISPISLEEKGKYINRVARMLPATPAVVNMLLKDLGIQDRIEEDTTPDDIRELLFTFEDPSKVGSGEGSSGSGNTQQGGSQSDTNSENKG